MAGDWIKVEISLPDKPEVFAIATYLMLDPDTVTGKLLRVWSWFNAHTRDGNAAGVTLLQIDRIASCQNFGEAMRHVGWLHCEKGLVSLPNFDRHNSQTAKSRALTALRVAQHRSQQRIEPTHENNEDVTTGALQDRYQRREEKLTTTTTTTLDAGAPFSFEWLLEHHLTGISEEVCKAWFEDRTLLDWTIDRAGRSIRLTAANYVADLKKFAAHWKKHAAAKSGAGKGGSSIHTARVRLQAIADEIKSLYGHDAFKSLPKERQDRIRELRAREKELKKTLLGD